MKPIAGLVVSSKPVSLPKAASILARFAASDTGAHQDVSAFLRRTSEAFDELARFHRDLGTRPERSGGGHGEEAGGKKKERMSKGEVVAVLATPDIEDNRRSRKKKKQQQHEGEVGVEAARDGRLVEIEGDPRTSAGRRGGSIFYPRESESGTREKKRAAKKMEDGIGNVVEVEREKGSKIEVKWMKNEDLKLEGVVENHSEQRRKKKRKKEEDVMEVSGGGVESHMERHRTKKRKKEDVMEGIGDGVENHVKSRHKKKRKVGEES